MKTKSNTTLPVVTLPRLSSQLENLADNLARFAVEFGIALTDDFPSRLATIGFTNGVMLGLQDPEAAANLDGLLAAEDLPPTRELQGQARAFAGRFTGEGSWTAEVYDFLDTQWQQSTDRSLEMEPRLELLLRILHGIRHGLAVAREGRETAGKVALLSQNLWVENQFLSRRLISWSQFQWSPFAPPFVEFTASCYAHGTAERQVITEAVAEILPVAKSLNAPWNLSFWVETGWNGGRNFARFRPKDCRTLLEEAGNDTLKACQNLYHRYVISTARSDGEVQIERAVLRYIGEFNNPDLARCYCSGREPRRLARIAYDFAFWMGIFASFPVPDINR